MMSMRPASFSRLVVAVVLGVLAVPAWSSPFLIGATYDGMGGECMIYDVDPVSGAASNPRSTRIDYLSGIAFSPNGTLYARTEVWGSQPCSLFRVDPDTGDSTLAGFVGKGGGDIDFDPDTGLLHAVRIIGGTPYGELFTIDPVGAEPTVVGYCSRWPWSLAFSPTAELYALDGENGLLLTLDKHNGSVLHEVPLVGANGWGIEFLPDGTALVIGDDTLGIWHLYTLDLGTGVMTPRGPTGLQQGLALAFLPEPEAIVFLSFGIAALLGLPKR